MEIAGSRVSLLLAPCGHVGGDLVGMFSAGDSRIGAYCLDVSGHGITSAMVTARVAGYLSSEFLEQNLALERRYGKYYALRDPQIVAERLNRRLTTDHGVSEYLTMVYAGVDMASGRVNLVQAGHPPPLWIHRDGTMEFIGDGGLPIGLLPEAQYHTHTIQLTPGDRLLFYSDGFTECTLRSGQMLDYAGLKQLVRATPPELEGPQFLDHLHTALRGLAAATDDMEDDISATLFEFQPNARAKK
jgi:sigma-B regulation protein RsbU (phosphoserine phosphatase)